MRRPALYTTNVVDHSQKSQPVSYGDVIGATFGYKYSPLTDQITEEFLFHDADYDRNFDFEEAVKGFEPYARYLVDAKNQEHFDFLKGNLQRNLERRDILERGSFLQSVAGEVLDPLNIGFGLWALPKLGLLVRPGATAGQAAFISAKAGAAAGAASEALRAPFDPLATSSEVALNIGSSALFGGAIGGVVAGGANFVKSRIGLKRGEDQFDEVTLADESLPDDVDGVKINYNSDHETGEAVFFDGEKIQVSNALLEDEYYEKRWTKFDDEPGYKKLGQRAFDTKSKYKEFLIHRALANRKAFTEADMRPEIKSKLDKARENLQKVTNPKAIEKIEAKIARLKTEGRQRYFEDMDTQSRDKVLTGEFHRPTTFTSSILHNNPIVATPFNKVLSGDATEGTKRLMIDMVDGGSLPLDRQAKGLGNTSYVQNLFFHKQKSNQFVAELENLAVEYYSGKKEAFRIGGKRIATPKHMKQTDQFIYYVIESRAALQRNPDLLRTLPSEVQRGIQAMDNLFDSFLDESQDVGIMSDVVVVRKTIKELEQKLDDIEIQMEATTDEVVLKYLNEQRSEHLSNLNFYNGLPEYIKNKHYFPRIFRREIGIDEELRNGLVNKIVFHAERQGKFKKIWNEDTGEWVDNPKSVKDIAEEIVARITADEQYLPYRITEGAAMRQKFFYERSLDFIPDEELLPFIHADASVFHHYAERVGRSIEWKRSFGDKTLSDIKYDIVKRERDAGKTDKEIAEIVKDFVLTFDLVNGRLIQNPEAISMRVASFINKYSGIAYLGRAGETALADAHGIVGANGLKNVLNSRILSSIDRNVLNKNIADIETISEAVGLGQSVNYRFMMENGELRSAYREEKIMNTALDIFHTIPGGSLLHPITRFFRRWQAGLTMSSIIERSVKLANGTAKSIEIEELARVGIDSDTARVIASYNNIWQKPNNLYYPILNEWPVDTAKGREVLRKYQAAVEASVHNAVIFAQYADKPIYQLGVLTVPFKPWMRKLGYEPDPRMTVGDVQYVRFESGIATLPFTFWSYGLGSLPRVLGRMLDSKREYRMQQAITAVLLGYLILKSRYRDRPEYFEYTSTEDIIARSINYSGLPAIYMDLFYTSLHTLRGAGVIDDFMGVKGMYSPSRLDAATEFAGAGVGVVQGFAESAAAFIDGDTRKGVAELSRSLPKLNLVAAQYDFEDLYNLTVDSD
jgi:hypothetical protein